MLEEMLEQSSELLADALQIDFSHFFEGACIETEFTEPMPQHDGTPTCGERPMRTDPIFTFRVPATGPLRTDPKYQAPTGGLFGFFGAEKRKAQAEATWQSDLQEWEWQNQRFAKTLADWEQSAQAEAEADERYRKACAAWGARRDAHVHAEQARNTSLRAMPAGYRDGSVPVDNYFVRAIEISFTTRIVKALPMSLSGTIHAEYQSDSRTLILDTPLPAMEQLLLFQPQTIDYLVKQKLLTRRDVPGRYDVLMYSLILRWTYEIYRLDEVDRLDAVVLNGMVTSLDPATGREVTRCVLSLFTSKDEFMALQLDRVEPKACFKKLKGVSSTKLHELTPVAPIQTITPADKRVIDGQAVAENVDEGTNLAAMDWEDFEHLIREVFEWEFGQGGSEVKVTQSSRDGGVDAIVIDPDPLRGGKIVIQAKRYTRTVGVSAVRDLWGTVEHEEALLGILVTTADYGPDAYEFAKGKRLKLINGGNLLHLMHKHGHKARIDLAEARSISAEH